MENKSINLKREEEYLKFLQNQEYYGASKVYSLRLEKAEKAEIDKIIWISPRYLPVFIDFLLDDQVL